MNWLENMIFKWRWLDNKITQWRLWYFRTFKLQSMPVPPQDWIDQMMAEQELRKKQEERQREEYSKREASEARRRAEQTNERAIVEESGGGDVIPKRWLCDRLSPQQAEADNTPRGGGLPFEKQNDKWERMKSSLRDGDEIWTFSSAAESWARLAGRAGLAVVREGRVVDCIITMMN